MQVLITGGAGFLGSNIAERFLESGTRVALLDNFATGRRDAIATHPQLTVEEGSVGDAKTVDALFDDLRPTHVIHAAAAYKDPNAWQEDVRTNVLGTANVVRASERHNTERFVYLQTALCYGRARERPIPVSHPLAPISSYAITKTAGEQYVRASNLSYVSLRLANIYGPRHYSGPMPAFYKRLKAGQPCTVVRTTRDFVEITDFLRLVDAVFERPNISGCFNVSAGKETSIREIYDTVALRVCPDAPPDARELDPNEDDVASLLLDSSETKRAFDWEPHVELQSGLDELIAWYDKNGVGDTYTHLRSDPDE